MKIENVVIIGSGLAGSLISNALVENCNVTVLELGAEDTISYPSVEYLKKHFGAVKTFCFGEGGTTNLWDNGLIPIKSSDVKSYEFNQVLNKTYAFMDKAASNLYFGNKSYISEYNSAVSEMSGIANSIGVFSDGVDCLMYPKRHKRLRINKAAKIHYDVSDINFVIKKDRISTVQYVSGGDYSTVNPDAVIICAGALGTPSLVKKILVTAGYPFEKSGMGLADHPMGFVGKVKIKKRFKKRIQKMTLCDKGHYIYRTAVRLKSECGCYTGCAFFRPALTMQNLLSIYKYKSLLGASSGKDRIRSAFSLKLFHPDILAEIYSHLFKTQIQSRVFNILLLFEQKRGNSRVFHDGNNLKVEWSITEEEMVIYNQILRKLKNMLSGISDELIFQMPINEDWLWSAAHHSGTISLGKNIDDLVDQDLKLKSCENVFVCDGSVIQEHSYANTGLTIGSLALRLAERLSRD